MKKNHIYIYLVKTFKMTENDPNREFIWSYFEAYVFEQLKSFLINKKNIKKSYIFGLNSLVDTMMIFNWHITYDILKAFGINISL